MADAPEWYPWYPLAFLGSVRGWPLAARGIYRELLDAQWDAGHIPDDPGLLAEMIGATPKEFAAAWKRIAPKFKNAGPGFLQNERLEVLRAEAVGRIEKYRDRARRGNAARWANKDASAILNGSLKDASAIPVRSLSIASTGQDSTGQYREGSAEGGKPAPTPAPELTLQPSAPAAPPASAPKKASPTKKTTLPENFELIGKRLDTAIRLLPEDCDYLAEFEKFKAFHLGKGSVMASWDGAWSYWCSNARNRTDYARKSKPTLKDSADARRKAGWWQPGDPTGREDLA